VRGRTPSNRHHRLLLPIALAVAVALLIAAAALSHRSEAHSTRVLVTISPTRYGRPLPAAFIGFSLEYTTLGAYAGRDARRIDPLLVTLIRKLGPAPVLRFGGDSTDWSWAPAAGLRRPPGIHFTLTNRWLRMARALARATNARLIVGINFEANSRALATAEARAITKAIGPSRIAALELGNEPELYATFGWYESAAGQPIPGRQAGWNGNRLNRDFARIGGALPRLPIAGPAIGGQQWIGWRAAVNPEYYALLMVGQADPVGATLLRIHGRPPRAVHAWATRSSSGALRVVLINESERGRLITLRGPGADATGGARAPDRPGPSRHARHHARRAELRQSDDHRPRWMFWLMQKTFSGSYCAFTRARRS
jgi:hypothetical protein